MNRTGLEQLSSGILKYISLDHASRQLFYDALISGSPDVDGTGAGDIGLAPCLIPLEAIEKREAVLTAIADTLGTDDVIAPLWLEQKRLENSWLTATAHMSGQKEVSAAFVDASTALYGQIDPELFYGCMHYILQKGYARRTPVKDTVLLDITKMVDLTTRQYAALPVPDRMTFERYQDFAYQYLEPFLEAIEPLRSEYQGSISGKDLAAVIRKLLRVVGADKEGWRVIVQEKVDRLSVNPTARTVRVAKRDLHMGFARLRGLLLHEVAVHVVRRLRTKGPQHVVLSSFDRLTKEEGLGVLVEQLTLRNFHALRIFRYVAIGLAWGVDGQKRNAREVYEVLWRLRFVSRIGEKEQAAKRYAALETMRVFRGIAPDTRGAVLLRDKAYVEGNAALWRYIIEQPLDYKAFKRLLQE